MMSCCIPTTSTSHTCVWNMSELLSRFLGFYITLPTVGVSWSPTGKGSLGWQEKTGAVPRHMVNGVAVNNLNQITTRRKPNYLPYAHIMVTKVKFLNSNPIQDALRVARGHVVNRG